jgi:hypothetical protein
METNDLGFDLFHRGTKGVVGGPRRLGATTDRVFSFVTADCRLAYVIRTSIAPVVLPAAMAFEAARGYFFQVVSPIILNYRSSPRF